MSELFSGKQAAYAAGRPGYAPEVSAFLTERFPPQRCPVAVDMGAGTGIFTRELLRLGYETFAVEPNDSMRARAEAALSQDKRFHSVAAAAESTPLAPACADIICAASAFHWFDLARFGAECRRLLRPQGQVVILCNARRLDEPFARAQDELCRRFLPRYESLDHGAAYTKRQIAAFFAPGCGMKTFAFDLEYDGEAFLQRCLSSSYSLRKGEKGFDEYVQALRSLIEGHAQDGRIRVGNDTLLWCGQPAK